MAPMDFFPTKERKDIYLLSQTKITYNTQGERVGVVWIAEHVIERVEKKGELNENVFLLF